MRVNFMAAILRFGAGPGDLPGRACSGTSIARELEGKAKEAEALARAEGKTLSGVIQEALRQARISRRRQALRGVQGFWSRKARERGLLTEQDLGRYLRT